MPSAPRVERIRQIREEQASPIILKFPRRENVRPQLTSEEREMQRWIDLNG